MLSKTIATENGGKNYAIKNYIIQVLVIYKGVLGGVKANAKTIPLTSQQKYFCWHFVIQNAYLAKPLGVFSERTEHHTRSCHR